MKNQPKISKRAKLIIFNIIAFLICLGGIIFVGATLISYYPIFEFAIAYLMLACLGMLVYYLSIIADALSARNKDGQEENSDIKK